MKTLSNEGDGVRNTAIMEEESKEEEEATLVNPGLALQPSYIPNDVIDVPGRHPFYLRHVAELPMVSADAVFHRTLERDISVVIRFVNLVHQWRTLLCPDSSDSMTACAVGGNFASPI